jgi:hypothetical protein
MIKSAVEELLDQYYERQREENRAFLEEIRKELGFNYPSAVPSPQGKLYKAPEAADRLRISLQRLYTLKSQGKIVPANKTGKLLFRESDIEAYLKREPQYGEGLK